MSEILTKIKQYLLAAAGGIIATLLAISYALFLKDRRTEEDNAGLRGQLLVKDKENEFKGKEKEADDAEKDYINARNAWLKSSGDGSTDEH